MNALISAEERNIKININILLSVFILFLFCSNFLGYGIYIPIILLPFILHYLNNNKFDRQFYFTISTLVMFFTLYSLIMLTYREITVGTAIRYVIIPPVIYIWAYKLIEKDYNYKKTITFIFTITISCVGYAFICLLFLIIRYGSMENAINILWGRYVINIWDGSLIKATLITPFLSFGLVLLPFIITKNKAKGIIPLKLISLILFAISLYSILLLGSRTGFVVILLSVIVSVLFTRKIGLRKILQLFISTLLLFSIYLMFIFDILNLKSIWEGSVLSSRFIEESILENQRMDAWITSFFGLFQYPLGGEKANLELNYAHNMWLDVGYSSGIFPFIFLVIITIIFIITILKFIKSDFPISLKSLILSIVSSMLAISFAEPIIEGSFIYFTLICFFMGLIHSLNINLSCKKLE